MGKVYTALNPKLKTYYYTKKADNKSLNIDLSPYEEMQIYINGKWVKKLIGRFEFLGEV